MVNIKPGIVQTTADGVAESKMLNKSLMLSYLELVLNPLQLCFMNVCSQLLASDQEVDLTNLNRLLLKVMWTHLS